MLKNRSILTILFSILALMNLSAKPYTVGVGDILEVNILQPDKSTNRTTVSPGGEISVPYLGTVNVKDKTLSAIQKSIQQRLAKGYLKYPVLTVSLIESRSRNYTISGEVIKPGSYPLRINTTVLKAISIAGGFTKYGSKSKVKILREQKGKIGYRKIPINIKAIMDGNSEKDILIESGDIIVVSESFF